MRHVIAVLTLLLVLTGPAFPQSQTADIFLNFDLDSTSFLYCDTGDIPAIMVACSTGTAAGDGWIPVGGFEFSSVNLILAALTVTGGIDTRIEGRVLLEDGTFSTNIILFDFVNKTLADGTEDQSVSVGDDHVVQIRVGIKIGTSDDPGAEDISVIWNGIR